jgi:hypothetical protein
MSPPQSQDAAPTPRSPIVPMVQRLESAKSLDSIANWSAPIARPTVSSRRLRGLLRGDWLGHAAHPVMTDFPLGAWMCTSVLDLCGGHSSRPAAERLLAFGLISAIPTALTGAADWTTTTTGSRRVGIVHAFTNLTAYGLYGASFVSRRRGRHLAGVGLGLLGGLTATVGGYLGGHLAIARNVGTSDPAFNHVESPDRPSPVGP